VKNTEIGYGIEIRWQYHISRSHFSWFRSYNKCKYSLNRSQWLCRLRHRSKAVSFLRLRVRIFLGAWMFVLCLLCVVLVAASVTSWSVQRNHTGTVCLIVCGLENLKERSGLGPSFCAKIVLHNLELKIFWRTFSMFLSTCPSTKGKSFREAQNMVRIYL
jgi:hypothetical protein